MQGGSVASFQIFLIGCEVKGMNEEQKIEELNQQLTALCAAQREAEASRPGYEAEIVRYEDRIADELLNQLLTGARPEVLDELMAEQARYQEALRKARLVPEACERRIKGVACEISKLERLLRRKERYQAEKDWITELLEKGDLERASYQAADLQGLARECGLADDADEFLAQMNLEVGV